MRDKLFNDELDCFVNNVKHRHEIFMLYFIDTSAVGIVNQIVLFGSMF